MAHRDRPLARWLAIVAGGVALASLALDGAFRLALQGSPRNAASQALYPWAARLELLVVPLLGAVVVLLIPAAGGEGDTPSRPPVARLGLPAAALAALAGWRFGLGDALALLLVYAATLWVGPRLAGARWPGVWWLLATAFALRAAAALALAAYGFATHQRSAVLDDEVAYDDGARQLAGILATGWGDLDFKFRHLSGHLLDLLAALYALVGADFTIFRLLNVGLGAITVGLVLGIGRATWGGAAARAAAWLVALWPSTIFWSATGLREPLAIAISLLFPWLLGLQPDARRRTSWLLAGVAGALALLVLAALRPESAVGLGLALLLVLRPRRPGRWARLAPVALVAGALSLVSLGSGVGGRAPPTVLVQQLSSPRALEYRAAVAQLTPLIEHDPLRLPAKPDPALLDLGVIVRVLPPGRARLETGITAGYATDPVRYRVLLGDGTALDLPPEQVQLLRDENVGWADVLGRAAAGARLLLVPGTPWDGQPPKRLLLAPDTLAWDALLALSLVAAWRERRRLSPTRALLFAYPWLMVLGLAATSTNLGTTARHRSTLVAWLALASAPLLARLVARARDALPFARAAAARRPAGAASAGGR